MKKMYLIMPDKIGKVIVIFTDILQSILAVFFMMGFGIMMTRSKL